MREGKRDGGGQDAFSFAFAFVSAFVFALYLLLYLLCIHIWQAGQRECARENGMREAKMDNCDSDEVGFAFSSFLHLS